MLFGSFFQIEGDVTRYVTSNDNARCDYNYFTRNMIVLETYQAVIYSYCTCNMKKRFSCTHCKYGSCYSLHIAGVAMMLIIVTLSLNVAVVKLLLSLLGDV